jgi:hypothetical protein
MRASAKLARIALAVTVLAAITAMLIGSSAGGAQAPASASASLSVVGTGHRAASRRDSFISVWPACACGRHIVLEQFSLADGRALGALARLPGGPGVQISDPHAIPTGPVWLTISTGPRYQSGVAGGDPAPDSCSGQVVRFDPTSDKSTTALTVPSSELTADAVPSPNGRLVVMVGGGCAKSFFNEHLVVENLGSGKQWTVGADAAPCHALFDAAWSPNGSQLVFPYGPSILSPHSRFVPRGTCDAPRFSRLVVVPAGHTTPVRSWKLILADNGWSYMTATFDRWGIAAIEGCEHGQLPGSHNDPNAGDAYLLQLNHRRRTVLRLRLARGYDGGGIATDPRTATVLVSESQNGGAGNFVWTYDGHKLRKIKRYANGDATTVVAEPW